MSIIFISSNNESIEASINILKISKLIKKATEVSLIPHHILSFYWKKRISTCLQRSNSRLIINAAKKVYNRAIEEEDLDYGPRLQHRI